MKNLTVGELHIGEKFAVASDLLVSIEDEGDIGLSGYIPIKFADAIIQWRREENK